MSFNITFTVNGLNPQQAQDLAAHLREILAAEKAALPCFQNPEPKAEKVEPKAEKAEKPEPKAEKPKAEKPEPDAGITRDSLKSLCLGKVRDRRANTEKIKVILNNRLLPDIPEKEFADIQAKLEAL